MEFQVRGIPPVLKQKVQLIADGIGLSEKRIALQIAFRTGSTSGGADELLIHGVTVSSFKMGRHEVTRARYAQITGRSPSYFTGDTSRPVERASWFDAWSSVIG
jgi:hypothetical protein